MKTCSQSEICLGNDKGAGALSFHLVFLGDLKGEGQVLARGRQDPRSRPTVKLLRQASEVHTHQETNNYGSTIVEGMFGRLLHVVLRVRSQPFDVPETVGCSKFFDGAQLPRNR